MTDAGHYQSAQGTGRLADSASGKCFTSDLSVNEFVLVKQMGFDPLGLVVGTSVYHVGIQIARWSVSQELTVLTQAMYHARGLAMERMITEATSLGADGIVGVRLELHKQVEGVETLEFLAVGTAVRSREHPGQFRSPDGRPFTSDLSGQDFATLMRGGYFPVSFVLGTCVYHVAHQGLMQSLRQIGTNVEMPQYTQAMYDARELAMSRMQMEGERVGASGIVGVQLSHHAHAWGGHAIEFLAIGTSVRELPNATGLPPVTLVQSMSN
jgi:uncharacterized protein YbjQ (UPF0145 family)